MARDAGAIEAKQATLTRNAHVETVFSDAGDLSSKIMGIEHTEGQYSTTSTIILDNRNRSIGDMRGQWVEIAYGDDGTALPTARQWVKTSQDYSAPGYLLKVLKLEGMWELLKEQEFAEGVLPFHSFTIQAGDTYIIDLIYTFLSVCGIDIYWGSISDGIIDVYQPYFEINNTPYETYDALIYRLICMTMCYIRMTDGMEAQLVFPQETDEPDITYHMVNFFNFTDGINEMIPNRIVVYYGATFVEIEGGAGSWVWPVNHDDILEAEAKDDASIGRYDPTGDGTGVTAFFTAPAIQSEEDAQNRANAILTRTRLETFSGHMLVPHDCRVELYDCIKVLDERG